MAKRQGRLGKPAGHESQYQYSAQDSYYPTHWLAYW